MDTVQKVYQHLPKVYQIPVATLDEAPVRKHQIDLNMAAGSATHMDGDAVVRELLQNCIDGCKGQLKRHHCDGYHVKCDDKQFGAGTTVWYITTAYPISDGNSTGTNPAASVVSKPVLLAVIIRCDDLYYTKLVAKNFGYLIDTDVFLVNNLSTKRSDVILGRRCEGYAGMFGEGSKAAISAHLSSTYMHHENATDVVVYYLGKKRVTMMLSEKRKRGNNFANRLGHLNVVASVQSNRLKKKEVMEAGTEVHVNYLSNPDVEKLFLELSGKFPENSQQIHCQPRLEDTTIECLDPLKGVSILLNKSLGGCLYVRGIMVNELRWSYLPFGLNVHQHLKKLNRDRNNLYLGDDHIMQLVLDCWAELGSSAKTIMEGFILYTMCLYWCNFNASAEDIALARPLHDWWTQLGMPELYVAEPKQRNTDCTPPFSIHQFRSHHDKLVRGMLKLYCKIKCPTEEHPLLISAKQSQVVSQLIDMGEASSKICIVSGPLHDLFEKFELVSSIDSYVLQHIVKNLIPVDEEPELLSPPELVRWNFIRSLVDKALIQLGYIESHASLQLCRMSIHSNEIVRKVSTGTEHVYAVNVHMLEVSNIHELNEYCPVGLHSAKPCYCVVQTIVARLLHLICGITESGAWQLLCHIMSQQLAPETGSVARKSPPVAKPASSPLATTAPTALETTALVKETATTTTATSLNPDALLLDQTHAVDSATANTSESTTGTRSRVPSYTSTRMLDLVVGEYSLPVDSFDHQTKSECNPDVGSFQRDRVFGTFTVTQTELEMSVPLPSPDTLSVVKLLHWSVTPSDSISIRVEQKATRVSDHLFILRLPGVPCCTDDNGIFLEFADQEGVVMSASPPVYNDSLDNYYVHDSSNDDHINVRYTILVPTLYFNHRHLDNNTLPNEQYADSRPAFQLEEGSKAHMSKLMNTVFPGLDTGDDRTTAATAVLKWCSEFQTASQEQQLAADALKTIDYIFINQLGYCRHRATACCVMLQFLGVNARYVASHNHAFVEVQLRHNYQDVWVQVDLGGGGETVAPVTRTLAGKHSTPCELVETVLNKSLLKRQNDDIVTHHLGCQRCQSCYSGRHVEQVADTHPSPRTSGKKRPAQYTADAIAHTKQQKLNSV